MADNIGNLYTIGAYATLIGLGYVIYHVSTQKSKKRVVPTLNKVTKTAQPEPRKEEKKKKQRLESFVSETQEVTNKAPKSEPQEKEKAPEPAKSSAKEDVDNREFARQLAKAQEGHKLTSKTDGAKQREKSVKQSRANKKAVVQEKPAEPEVPVVQSAPSSHGADADDDASSANSPEARPVDVSGVSDMLEPAPAGPSILRLTDTTSKKQKKAAKAPEPAETKKQRQNRKKAEAAKAAREDSEKERKVLEENQRRTARIAEGRAAKDGSEFMAAANVANSAWTQGAPNGTNGVETKNSEDSTIYEPLDTFEKKPAPTQAPTPAVKKESSLKPEDSWISTLPSEEEQMEMLRDESDEWSTVKTKSKKSKKAPSSADSGDDRKESQPASQPKQAATNNQQAAKPAPPKNFGSFSALTVKDDDAEEIEEEWEV
ncbi:hypothetical protein PT974_08877 [Cladobotryum mycophilum]|uniref:Uncharacterized protein n=1 Tax=Cladobotryum mycophilum TaxID=491253 RepID=A0ABR0SEJ8_9HYPO